VAVERSKFLDGKFGDQVVEPAMGMGVSIHSCTLPE